MQVLRVFTYLVTFNQEERVHFLEPDPSLSLSRLKEEIRFRARDLQRKQEEEKNVASSSPSRPRRAPSCAPGRPPNWSNRLPAPLPVTLFLSLFLSLSLSFFFAVNENFLLLLLLLLLFLLLSSSSLFSLFSSLSFLEFLSILLLLLKTWFLHKRRPSISRSATFLLRTRLLQWSFYSLLLSLLFFFFFFLLFFLSPFRINIRFVQRHPRKFRERKSSPENSWLYSWF